LIKISGGGANAATFFWFGTGVSPPAVNEEHVTGLTTSHCALQYKILKYRILFPKHI
jgi:hypothetical protein